MKEPVVLVSRRPAGSKFQREGVNLENKSTFAIVLEPIAENRQSGYITCRVQSVRDSVLTEKVRQMQRKQSVEVFVAEKRQLVMNLLRDRQPVEILQSGNNVLEFPHA